MTNRLIKATIENFKGLKERVFEFDNETAFAGTNASFKTTLFDAVLWAVTGKNHLAESEFDIKTRKGNGVQHQIHHSVELEFDNFIIKRDYYEIWRTKKGTTTSKFDGHTTDYYIDRKNNMGLIKCDAEKEFVEFMAENFGGKDYVENFLLCSNPLYCSQVMTWKNLRSLIFKMVSPVADEEVFKSLPEYPALPNLLCSGTPDVLIAGLKKRLNELNKEMVEVGVRIDETEKQIPEQGLESREDIEKKIEVKKSLIDAEKIKLNNISVSVDLIQKQGRLKQALADAKREYQEKQTERKTLHDKKQQELSSAYSKKISTLTQEKETAESDISFNSRQKKKLLDELSESEKKFETISKQNWEGSEKCYACNQLLPDSEISKLVSAFKGEKAKKLRKLIANAEEINKELDKLEAKRFPDPVKLQKDIEKLVKPETEEFKEEKADFSSIEVQISLVADEISKAGESIKERQKPVLEAIQALETEIEALNKEIAVFDDIDKKNERIKKHRERQNKLSDQFAVTAEQVDAIQAFIMKKVDLMEDDIFKVFGVKFSMFERQINGGLKEECRILVDCNGTLVPSESANNAGRINVGIKLCAVFQKYFSIEAPVFIDNAESIVKIESHGLQIIKLIVDGNYKTLTKI
jgi:DNA repair exonuclease SbcCD ATPase subunit